MNDIKALYAANVIQKATMDNIEALYIACLAKEADAKIAMKLMSEAIETYNNERQRSDWIEEFAQSEQCLELPSEKAYQEAVEAAYDAANAAYEPFRINADIARAAYTDACGQVYRNLPRVLKGLHFERDSTGEVVYSFF